MNDLLADIKTKLQNGDYKNEEHIRFSLVARVLHSLGWDIWNPNEVNTEFIVVPNEDKTRVDVALFSTPFAPDVYIEIKDVGQIQKRLADVERQLRDYNRNNTAMFTIITDGREWRFYYSQTGGEFSKKLFENFSLQEANLNDIEESLATFLKKSEIVNGNAKRKAENYLQKNRVQQTAEDCLQEARRRITEPPYPSMPNALVALVGENGYSITQSEAENFIKESYGRKPSSRQQNVDSKPAIPQPASSKSSVKTQAGWSLFCRSKGAEARGQQTQNGFIIFQGSTAVLQERPAAKTTHPWVVSLRIKLVSDGTLVQQDGFYVFTKDAHFPSPSSLSN